MQQNCEQNLLLITKFINSVAKLKTTVLKISVSNYFLIAQMNKAHSLSIYNRVVTHIFISYLKCVWILSLTMDLLLQTHNLKSHKWYRQLFPFYCFPASHVVNVARRNLFTEKTGHKICIVASMNKTHITIKMPFLTRWDRFSRVNWPCVNISAMVRKMLLSYTALFHYQS